MTGGGRKAALARRRNVQRVQYILPARLHRTPAAPAWRLPARRIFATRMVKPIVLAMIVCDHYYRDVHTGKSVLAGTFSSINSPTFPTKHGNCAIYLALTDVASQGTLQLEFRQETAGFSMKLPSWQVQAPENRRAVVEIGGNINGLPVPAEGEYEFVVLWDSQPIFSRRLRAVRVDLAGQQAAPPGDATAPDA